MFTVVYDVKFLQFIMKFIFKDYLHSDGRNTSSFYEIPELSRFTETAILRTSVVLISYCRLAHAAQSDRRIKLLYLIEVSWIWRGFIWLMLGISDSVS
jgi:hypothetical protein